LTVTQKALDTTALRADFPILHQQINGYPLAFLDSAASSQRPQQVIDSLNDYSRRYHANVHRGVYRLSEEATLAYEQARAKVASFIGATRPQEIVFTRNTTEAVNLVAHAWGNTFLKAGDRILLTVMEHHSNLVPWQMLAERVGAQIDYLPIDAQGRLALDQLDTLLTERTRLVAVTHQSNVLGTINPVRELAQRAHAVGALILVDGAQSVPHMPVNVHDLDADFLVFSGHKMCGPTGIGVLWGRYDLLNSMPPFLGGGSMIEIVTLEGTTYATVPARFEAGTPAIGEAIALGAAVDYLQQVGMQNISQHEHELVQAALDTLGQIAGLQIYGPTSSKDRGGTVSFTLEGVHPHDVAAILDESGIAVRAGHHCAQPLHRLLGETSTTRASFYLYNTLEEIDRLAEGLAGVYRLFNVSRAS
jgi:cysteine desulfurase/selenocysteine lyase